MVRYQWESGALWEEVEGNEGGSLAAAGLISGGAQASLSAAVRRLWGRSENRGGMHALQAKIGTGVEEKQLVIHLSTLFQKTVILSCIVVLGEKRSQPRVRIGIRRPMASGGWRKGGRREPGEESC